MVLRTANTSVHVNTDLFHAIQSGSIQSQIRRTAWILAKNILVDVLPLIICEPSLLIVFDFNDQTTVIAI